MKISELHGSLKGYRTYILSGLAVVSAWLYWLVGDFSTDAAVTATVAAVGGAGARKVVKGNKEDGGDPPAGGTPAAAQ